MNILQENIILIFGCGNSRRYINTYHNIGSDMINKLVSLYHDNNSEQSIDLRVISHEILHKTIHIYSSNWDIDGKSYNTFLVLDDEDRTNLSGEILYQFIKYKKLDINRMCLFILHDDFHTTYGKVKFKLLNQSNTRHNAIRDIKQNSNLTHALVSYVVGIGVSDGINIGNLQERVTTRRHNFDQDDILLNNILSSMLDIIKLT